MMGQICCYFKIGQHTVMASPTLWIIAGPTASGKSHLAVNMAESMGGEILNADSMQIYQDLNILTACPTPQDRQRVPHHGYQFLQAHLSLSAGAWYRWAMAEIQRLNKAGKTAFVVGGTGLYLKTLTHGFIDLPPIDAMIRFTLENRLIEEGLDKLYQELAQCDPPMAQRLAHNDRQRIIRALEIWQATGQTLSDWQKKSTQHPSFQQKTILLLPERDQLNKRADQRVIDMVNHGAIDEIKALLANVVSSDAPIFRALGAKPFFAYLCQQLSRQQAIAQTQCATRQYIKRQFTWFRHQITADYTLTKPIAKGENFIFK